MNDTVLSSVFHRRLRLGFMPKVWVSAFTLRLGNAADSINIDARLDLEWTMVYKVMLVKILRAYCFNHSARHHPKRSRP